MKIVVVEPNKKAYTKEITGTLESMQEIVGGYIECVPFGTMRNEIIVGGTVNNWVIVCNEEGKLKGLEPNFPYGNYDIICGTAFICGVVGEDFVGLTDNEAEDVMQMFESVYRNWKEGVSHVVSNT